MRGLVYAALVALAALLPAPAVGQTLTSEQVTALHRDVNERLLRECGRSADSLRYRNVSGEYEYSLSVQWTGGCVDGVRDGFGRYSIVTRGESGSTSFPTMLNVSEGAIVRGRQVGLWCTLSSSTDGVEHVRVPSCYLVSGDTLIGSFAKQADGSWRRVNGFGAASDEVYAPGSFEAESERLIAAARAGSFGGPINLQGQTGALSDLIAGATIRLSPDPSVRSLRGKRVAIVLSSQAIAELERWTAERQTAIDALQRFRRDETFESSFSIFVRQSDPARLVMGASATILSAGGVPFAADDLSVLQDGRADYVLILDWRHSANIPTTARALRALPICAPTAPCENGIIFESNFRAYLVAPDMRAIATFGGPSIPVIRHDEEFNSMSHLAVLLAAGAGIDASAQPYLPGATYRYVE